MARTLRFLGRLCVVVGVVLFLPWGAFALFAAVTFNSGGILWSHPAIETFLMVEATLAGAAVLLLSVAALTGRRLESAGDK
jgi:hypothetical protein